MSSKTTQSKITADAIATVSLPVDSVELLFTPETVTFEDKTKAKSTWSAFDFPDGAKGAIIITKLIKSRWEPIKDIKRVIVEFQ